MSRAKGRERGLVIHTPFFFSMSSPLPSLDAESNPLQGHEPSAVPTFPTMRPISVSSSLEVSSHPSPVALKGVTNATPGGRVPLPALPCHPTSSSSSRSSPPPPPPLTNGVSEGNPRGPPSRLPDKLLKQVAFRVSCSATRRTSGGGGGGEAEEGRGERRNDSLYTAPRPSTAAGTTRTRKTSPSPSASSSTSSFSSSSSSSSSSFFNVLPPSSVVYVHPMGYDVLPVTGYPSSSFSPDRSSDAFPSEKERKGTARGHSTRHEPVGKELKGKHHHHHHHQKSNNTSSTHSTSICRKPKRKEVVNDGAIAWHTTTAKRVLRCTQVRRHLNAFYRFIFFYLFWMSILLVLLFTSLRSTAWVSRHSCSPTTTTSFPSDTMITEDSSASSFFFSVSETGQWVSPLGSSSSSSLSYFEVPTSDTSSNTRYQATEKEAQWETGTEERYDTQEERVTRVEPSTMASPVVLHTEIDNQLEEEEEEKKEKENNATDTEVVEEEEEERGVLFLCPQRMGPYCLGEGLTMSFFSSLPSSSTLSSFLTWNTTSPFSVVSSSSPSSSFIFHSTTTATSSFPTLRVEESPSHTQHHLFEDREPNTTRIIETEQNRRHFYGYLLALCILGGVQGVVVSCMALLVIWLFLCMGTQGGGGKQVLCGLLFLTCCSIWISMAVLVTFSRSTQQTAWNRMPLTKDGYVLWVEPPSPSSSTIHVEAVMERRDYGEGKAGSTSMPLAKMRAGLSLEDKDMEEKKDEEGTSRCHGEGCFSGVQHIPLAHAVASTFLNENGSATSTPTTTTISSSSYCSSRFQWGWWVYVVALALQCFLAWVEVVHWHCLSVLQHQATEVGEAYGKKRWLTHVLRGIEVELDPRRHLLEEVENADGVETGNFFPFPMKETTEGASVPFLEENLRKYSKKKQKEQRGTHDTTRRMEDPFTGRSTSPFSFTTNDGGPVPPSSFGGSSAMVPLLRTRWRETTTTTSALVSSLPWSSSARDDKTRSKKRFPRHSSTPSTRYDASALAPPFSLAEAVPTKKDEHPSPSSSAGEEGDEECRWVPLTRVLQLAGAGEAPWRLDVLRQRTSVKVGPPTSGSDFFSLPRGGVPSGGEALEVEEVEMEVVSPATQEAPPRATAAAVARGPSSVFSSRTAALPCQVSEMAIRERVMWFLTPPPSLVRALASGTCGVVPEDHLEEKEKEKERRGFFNTTAASTGTLPSAMEVEEKGVVERRRSETMTSPLKRENLASSPLPRRRSRRGQSLRREGGREEEENEEAFSSPLHRSRTLERSTSPVKSLSPHHPGSPLGGEGSLGTRAMKQQSRMMLWLPPTPHQDSTNLAIHPSLPPSPRPPPPTTPSRGNVLRGSREEMTSYLDPQSASSFLGSSLWTGSPWAPSSSILKGRLEKGEDTRKNKKEKEEENKKPVSMETREWKVDGSSLTKMIRSSEKRRHTAKHFSEERTTTTTTAKHHSIASSSSSASSPLPPPQQVQPATTEKKRGSQGRESTSPCVKPPPPRRSCSVPFASFPFSSSAPPPPHPIADDWVYRAEQDLFYSKKSALFWDPISKLYYAPEWGTWQLLPDMPYLPL